MLKKFSNRYLLLSILLFLISVPVIAIIHSEIAAKEYITELRSSASAARTATQALEISVDSPLLNNPGETSSTRHSDAQKFKNAITTCQTQINELSVKSQELPALNYAKHIGTFAVADALKERSQRIVNQTRDTLARYDQTISFLEIYATSLERSTKMMDEFNAIHDFNEYQGRSGHFRQIAIELQAESNMISDATAPSELAVIQKSAVQTLRQLSSQMTSLADGIDVAIDDMIYSSIHDIETTDTQLAMLAGETYIETVSQLRVIRDISHLDEQFDLLLPQS